LRHGSGSFPPPAGNKNGLVAGAGGVTVEAAMKILPGKRRVSGFTLFEVLAILAILAILAALLLPDLLQRRRPYRGLSCASNLKQIGIAYIMWEEDHGGKFPAQIPSAEKGSMEMISSGYACLQFRPLSPYMPRNIWAFACPADKTKFAATNYNPLLEENVSYFANVDATTNNPANTILAGDRNLSANGQSVNPGLFVMTTNFDMSWTHEIHALGGNLVFADGHVEWVNTTQLNSVVQRQLLATNRLIVP
jgi:prepilin-type processing-associated H-X9-DG protein